MRKKFNRAKAGVVLACFLVLGFGFGGCSKETEPGTPLIQVGEFTITREKIDQAFVGLPEEEQVKYLDRAGRRQLLDNLVTVELMYQEAQRQKLDQDPRIRLKLEGLERQILVEELINRSIMPADLYRMFQEQFIKIRSLMVQMPEGFSPETQAQAKAEAENLAAALKQGQDWKQVITKKLPAPLQLDQKDWGYISREDLGDSLGFEIQEAVFALKKPGEFTRPILRDEGILITQVLETPGNLNPEAFTPDLAGAMLARKKEEVYRGYVTDLRTRYQKDIKPNSANLEDFLSLGDRAASPNPVQEAEGTTVEKGGTEASPAPGVENKNGGSPSPPAK